MKQKTKKKLCWNCDGHAAFEDENCPYCGVYLNPLSIGGDAEKENSLFAPPYRISQEEEQEIPASPFVSQGSAEEPKALTAAPQLDDLIHAKAEDMKAVILPLVLLLSGSMLFFFGTALLLFSENGKFTLTWDASLWFLYFLISGPFLFFGWKALEKISDQKS